MESSICRYRFRIANDLIAELVIAPLTCRAISRRKSAPGSRQWRPEVGTWRGNGFAAVLEIEELPEALIGLANAVVLAR